MDRIGVRCKNMSSSTGPKMELLSLLRGGGGRAAGGRGTREVRRRLEDMGIHLSPTTAGVLTFSSLVLVSIGLPSWLPTAGAGAPLLERSYWLTRIVLLRGLGLVYFVAFLAALRQNGALLGDKGLLPASRFLARVRRAYDPGSSPPDAAPAAAGGARAAAPPQRSNAWWSTWAKALSKWSRWSKMMVDHPTLLHLAGPGQPLDPWLRGVAQAGVGLSSLVLLRGASNVPIQVGLHVHVDAWMDVCVRSCVV